nr:hypothetical protein B0A51_16710 [Rachicladosporium sp. CCFEE 5018]
MHKTASGKLEPYSFGHKWKDGSLRTDIPLKSLNLHFNVNFSIVSQVNPHINLFFFSSRGSVGRPVTHRKGRGWRGGFIGSAVELYIKQDLTKWLKFLRHLELLPRPLGQDWSQIWLQRFSGTITIWPKSIMSDYWNILSDPTKDRLGRMIHAGQLAAWPKLKFVSNRMVIEKVIEDARQATRPPHQPLPTPMPLDKQLRSFLSEDDLTALLEKAKSSGRQVEVPSVAVTPLEDGYPNSLKPPSNPSRPDSPSLSKRFSGWFGSKSQSPSRTIMETVRPNLSELRLSGMDRRRPSVLEEIKRQTSVLFDDGEPEESGEEISGEDVSASDDHDTEDETNHSADGPNGLDDQLSWRQDRNRPP